MVDVVVYGNLVIDTVFDRFTKKTTLGGIANIWDAIQNIDPNIAVELEPVCIGTALIYINSDNATKVSRPNLQIECHKPSIVASRVSHIAYLNQLPNLSFIQEIQSDIVTADIAGINTFDYEILRYIDYLFISEDELLDYKCILKNIKGSLIVHRAGGSTLYRKDGSQEQNSHMIIKKINVLGAGDFLASAFIVNILKNQSDKQAMSNAHKQTLQFLTNKLK